MPLPSSLSPSKARNFSPPTSTISPPTTSLSPFAPPVAQFTPSPHLFVQDRKITSSLRDEDDARARRLMLQEEEIHSAARRLRRRLPKRGCEVKKAGALLQLEASFVRGKPLITSTRSLLLTDASLSISTPLDPLPRPAVLAICSDVLVLGLKVQVDKEEKLYFDWRLEGQRIIKLARCDVEEDPTTKVITFSTPLTTLYIHPSSSSTTSLYQTLLQHLTTSNSSTSLPPTPPASPACPTTSRSATPTSPTSPTSPLPQARPKRAVPPSSFHSRPLSQISSHSATSTTSISSLRSVSSFRSDWQPVWVKDDDCAGCMVCGETWGWKRRRHHCRACGRLICYECSSFRPSIFGSLQPMRSCTTCSTAMDRDSDDDEEELEHGEGGSQVGLGIYGDEEEEGSDGEGTVRGGSERGDKEEERVDPDEESLQNVDEGGLGRVREEDEAEGERKE